ncbi:MoaD/ThiS family protein [Stieleria sp. TO1_6]|uniref:MoaD/ThiS family protein n=1 Tax=Stieleria tagensis TaxID=2956795 RepID=UPI00209B887D|nr:MoaD/ThiS family protein [Stieleria tagensis]MCO8124038.1 MoaD/ThiS family protein [Stieleria tagensis]
MVTVEFTSQLAQHVDCPTETLEAATIRELFDVVFKRNPQARGYILDDQDCIRKHVAVFIDGQLLHQRENLDTPLGPNSQVYVMQALSGG